MFIAAEINSTFYRAHRAATYARWRDSTPGGFRFAVKCPRTITHEAKLVDAQAELERFLSEVRLLGDKLGPVLVQLPPKLAFDAAVAARFFAVLRSAFAGGAACEPRHPSWFEAEADALLEAHRIARVAADPLRHPLAGEPGGWRGIAYWRLHGSPVMYRSSYDEASLEALAGRLCREEGEVWCVFDNTTTGAAAANALDLQGMIARRGDSTVFGG